MISLKHTELSSLDLRRQAFEAGWLHFVDDIAFMDNEEWGGLLFPMSHRLDVILENSTISSWANNGAAARMLRRLQPFGPQGA